MSKFASKQAREFYAQTYDTFVSDWPGEIDFYQALSSEALTKGEKVLELACGTGRIAIRIAKHGVEVVGLDLSSAMLDIAREKSAGMSNISWVQQDMTSFKLGETFGLIIIPGHSFQNILTAADQIACLKSIERHLDPHGSLVVHLDHQDISWLGDLVNNKGGIFETAEQFNHPKTGRQVRTSRAWSYEPSTQTAIAQTVWEEMTTDGEVAERWETGPIRFHCFFRFEMEHLLATTGFEVEAVYGDFSQGALLDESEEMIWIAKKTINRNDR